MNDVTDDLIRDVLRHSQCVAVVGFSLNPARASHYVAQYLQDIGKRVIPVNPGHGGEMALGEVIYPDLASIPDPVDMIDIFRRPDHVPPIVDGAIAHLPQLRSVWMQIGVVNDTAAATARAAGLDVVMDRCPKVEYPRLLGGVTS